MSITGDQIRRISKNLNWFYADAQSRAKPGLFDIHKDAERIFGTILGKVLGCDLEDLNRKKYNHPAVDFGNTQAGVAVQVTTTVSDQKIRHTLDTFMKYKLDEQYGHIIVMVIAPDVDGLTVPVAPANVIFTKDDIWSIPKLVSKIEAMDDAEIAQLDQYLQTQMGSLQNVNASRPERKQLNLGLSALAPGEFLGRNEELDAIEQRVREHYNPIELYGFGGMGKTELAIEYGRRKMADSDVFFVRFDTSIRNTITGPIAGAFSGYSKKTADGLPKPEPMVYAEVMDLLGALSEETILIIDNVDSEEMEFSDLCGPEYAALCRMRMNLIITTRFDRKEQGGIEVGALQKQYLDEMMLRILKNTPIKITQQQMDDLIRAVDCHTLAVELIARTLKMTRPRISPEELLEKLRTGDLSSSRFARVDSHKDREQQKRRIEEHIQNLFHISSLPPEELGYMTNAVLMDEEKGLPYEWFAEAQPDFDQDVMQHLLDRGWIRLDVNTDVLALHPLVRQIARTEITPQDELRMRFFSGLWDIFSRIKSDMNRPDPIASIFASLPASVWDRLPKEWYDEICDWYQQANESLRQLCEQYKRQLDVYRQEIIKLIHDVRISYQAGKRDFEDVRALTEKTIEYIDELCSDQTDNRKEWWEIYVVAGLLHLDAKDVQPDRALAFFQRAKELGAEDVDDLIEKAKAILES